MRLISRNRANRYQLIMAHKRVMSTLKSASNVPYDPKLTYHCDKKGRKNLEVSFFIVLLSLNIVNISDILP